MIRKPAVWGIAALCALLYGCDSNAALFGNDKKKGEASPSQEQLDNVSADSNGGLVAVDPSQGDVDTTTDDAADGESDSDDSSADGETGMDETADDAESDSADVDETDIESPPPASEEIKWHGPIHAQPRVIVKFRPGATANERAALHRKFGHRLEGSIPQLNLHAVKVPPGKTPEEVMARYERHPLVEYVELENFAEPQMTPNDPQYGSQAYLHIDACSFMTGICYPQMDAQRAWDSSIGSAIVPIGVLDTGLDTSHYEFVERLARGEIYGYDFKDGDTDFYDPSGHGTAVGGVIGAQANNALGVAGVDWNNPMVVMRTGFGWDAREAIVWATDNGVRVINMSFGSGIPTSSWESTCQYAFDHGVVLIGAAGNAGSEAQFYPAAYPTVLAVTGVDGTGEPMGYNYGSWVDVSAVATGIRTTVRVGTGDRYDLGYVAGTSIAAPLVSAAAGLVLSVNPDLTPQCVFDILKSTADDIGAPGFDVFTGYGRVNFYRAVQAAQTWDCGTPQDTIVPAVAVVAPTADEVLSGVSDVLVDASDNVRVTRVDLYRDGQLFGSDDVAPHEWSVDTTTLSDGPHTFSARAFDAAGNSANSDAVTVTIENASGCVSSSDCNDGDACTADSCVNGSCTHTSVSCNDGSACTTDFCDPATGCVYDAIDCDDGNACTADGCDAATGCVNEPIAGCCGNGACEVGESSCSCSADCGRPEAMEVNCSDGRDDDCDGLVDGDDPDCEINLGCGNGICEGNGEDCNSCPQDCRCGGGNSCRACCGDGVCGGPGENFKNCPVDCN